MDAATPSVLSKAITVGPILTPLNTLLLTIIATSLYLHFRPATIQTLPGPPPPILFRTYTPETLRPFDGTQQWPVRLAIRGRVFDVSGGRNFYGPGGPYENFAGKDASRGLACGSFDDEMLTKDLKGPLDDLKDLGEDELDALKGWEERFEEKYLVVGKLVACGEAEGKGDGKS